MKVVYIYYSGSVQPRDLPWLQCRLLYVNQAELRVLPNSVVLPLASFLNREFLV